MNRVARVALGVVAILLAGCSYAGIGDGDGRLQATRLAAESGIALQRGLQDERATGEAVAATYAAGTAIVRPTVEAAQTAAAFEAMTRATEEAMIARVQATAESIEATRAANTASATQTAAAIEATRMASSVEATRQAISVAGTREAQAAFASATGTAIVVQRAIDDEARRSQARSVLDYLPLIVAGLCVAVVAVYLLARALIAGAGLLARRRTIYVPVEMLQPPAAVSPSDDEQDDDSDNNDDDISDRWGVDSGR